MFSLKGAKPRWTSMDLHTIRGGAVVPCITTVVISRDNSLPSIHLGILQGRKCSCFSPKLQISRSGQCFALQLARKRLECLWRKLWHCGNCCRGCLAISLHCMTILQMLELWQLRVLTILWNQMSGQMLHGLLLLLGSSCSAHSHIIKDYINNFVP